MASGPSRPSWSRRPRARSLVDRGRTASNGRSSRWSSWVIRACRKAPTTWSRGAGRLRHLPGAARPGRRPHAVPGRFRLTARGIQPGSRCRAPLHPAVYADLGRHGEAEPRRRAAAARLWISTWMLSVRPDAAASSLQPADQPGADAGTSELRQQRDVHDPDVTAAAGRRTADRPARPSTSITSNVGPRGSARRYCVSCAANCMRTNARLLSPRSHGTGASSSSRVAPVDARPGSRGRRPVDRAQGDRHAIASRRGGKTPCSAMLK